MASIKLLFKHKILKNYQIGVGDTLLIGRDNSNDILVDNLAVSAQHAKIESIGDQFLFVDLDSENGSYVNDKSCKSHWLNHGDNITIGKHTLQFSNSTNQKQQKIKSSMIAKTMQIDSKKIRELMKLNKSKDQEINDSSKTNVNRRKKLVVMLSYLSGKKEPIQLTKKSIKIGKDAKSDVLVKGFGVGKTAAIINKVSNFWYISYVQGLSKPRVNSVTLKKTLKLNNLDIISIGSTKLQILFDFQN